MIFYPKSKIKNEPFVRILSIIKKQTFLLPKDYDNSVLKASIQQRMHYSFQNNILSYIHLLEHNPSEVNELAREIIACDKKSDHDKLYNTLFHNSFEGIILYNIDNRTIPEAGVFSNELSRRLLN